jgi:hypothetical protein
MITLVQLIQKEGGFRSTEHGLCDDIHFQYKSVLQEVNLGILRLAVPLCGYWLDNDYILAYRRGNVVDAVAWIIRVSRSGREFDETPIVRAQVCETAYMAFSCDDD